MTLLEGVTPRIGVDVGGTKIEVVRLDADGAVADRFRRDTQQGTVAVVDGICSAVAAVLPDAPGPATVGVGIPGTVDSAGRVRQAINLGVVDLDLATILTERLHLPVRVENDVNAAALAAAAMTDSDGQPDEVIALLNLGTGLAAGWVVGGRLVRGLSGASGEIGHIPVDPNGVLCGCGQVGCLETIASGSAVARLWPTPDPVPARDLFARAAAGDPAARDVRSVVISGIARAVQTVALTMDPSRIILGGGLSQVGDDLFGLVSAQLDAVTSPFLASLRLSERLRRIPSDVPVGAIGAALAGATTPTRTAPAVGASAQFTRTPLIAEG